QVGVLGKALARELEHRAAQARVPDIRVVDGGRADAHGNVTSCRRSTSSGDALYWICAVSFEPCATTVNGPTSRSSGKNFRSAPSVSGRTSGAGAGLFGFSRWRYTPPP